MTMHGENTGSRKVEPEKNGLPKWRLHANYILRELARLWYGRKSIFNLKYGYDKESQFWREFVFRFVNMTYLFGEAHGVPPEEAAQRLLEANRKWLIWHGGKPTFSEPYYEAKWHAIQMLGDELAEKLFDDSDIRTILSFVGYIHTFASKGVLPPYNSERKLPSYASFEWVKSLEYYEALPVDPS